MQHPTGSLRRNARPGHDGHPSAVHVLIVDGSADCRESLRTVLSVEGAAVQTSATAREALHLVDLAVPDIVISDTRLPVVDGYELIAMMRAHRSDAVRRLPVIALTAATTVGERIKILAAGFTTHLTRPVNADELVVTLASLVGLSIAEPAAAKEETPISLRDYAPTIYELPNPDADTVGSLQRPLATIHEWLTSVDITVGAALTAEARAQIAEIGVGIQALIDLLTPATAAGTGPRRTT